MLFRSSGALVADDVRVGYLSEDGTGALYLKGSYNPVGTAVLGSSVDMVSHGPIALLGTGGSTLYEVNEPTTSIGAAVAHGYVLTLVNVSGNELTVYLRGSGATNHRIPPYGDLSVYYRLGNWFTVPLLT